MPNEMVIHVNEYCPCKCTVQIGDSGFRCAFGSMQSLMSQKATAHTDGEILVCVRMGLFKQQHTLTTNTQMVRQQEPALIQVLERYREDQQHLAYNDHIYIP